jgi:hypothetical protein
MILKNIFVEIFGGENMGVFAQTNASFLKKLIITLVFEKIANFFRRKLAKIAENCDHNIDPCLPGVDLTNLHFSPKIE